MRERIRQEGEGSEQTAQGEKYLRERWSSSLIMRSGHGEEPKTEDARRWRLHLGMKDLKKRKPVLTFNFRGGQKHTESVRERREGGETGVTTGQI